MNQIYLNLINGRKQLAEYDGNPQLFCCDKVAFLSSDITYKELEDMIARWINIVKRENKVIVSGFQSRPEHLVLSLALQNKIPVIWVMNKGINAHDVPKDYLQAEKDGLLTRLTMFESNIKTPSEATSYLRNQFVADICEEIVIGSIRKNGRISSFMIENSDRKMLIFDNILYNK